MASKAPILDLVFFRPIKLEPKLLIRIALIKNDINNTNLMMKANVVALLLLIVLASAKVSIHNLGLDFIPQDELDYVNFLKLILGRNDQSTSLSASFAQFAANHRPSLANALDQVALVFVPYAAKQQVQDAAREIEIKGKLIRELVFGTPQLFLTTYLPANEKKSLESLMENFQAHNKAVHVIRGSESELRELKELLNPEVAVKASSRRLSEKQTLPIASVNGTYLIKFFFSLLFVIVIIGIVGFIASNDGKKDTLLYAKFIADAGNAR